MAEDVAAVVDGKIVFMYKDESTIRLLSDKSPWSRSCDDVISLDGHKGEEQVSLVLLARQWDCRQEDVKLGSHHEQTRLGGHYDCFFGLGLIYWDNLRYVAVFP